MPKGIDKLVSTPLRALNSEEIMKSFKQFLSETTSDGRLQKLMFALEHLTYKPISGTKNSYRIDPQNTTTKTQKHAHVYAKPNGEGKQLYSVNIDGSGHDSSSGTVISVKHADHFRSLGFDIPDNFTLESIDYEQLNPENYEICILEEDG